MSNPDRQRILRRTGPDPAEAERQSGAAKSREAKRQEDAELEAEQRPSPDEPTPLAENPEGPPRPRR